MDNKTKSYLGEVLVKQNIITPTQLETALREQEQTGELLGIVLLKLGYITEESVFLPALAEHLEVEHINLRGLKISDEVIRQIPAQFATHYQIIPIEFKDNTLTIASIRPQDIDIVDGVSLLSSAKIKMVLASEKDILEAIRKYYGVGAETIDRMLGSVQKPDIAEDAVSLTDEIDSEASIGKFINQILLEAVRDRATDIHIEPFEKDLKVRYRVDGVLYDTQLPKNIWHFKDSINSRIKILSNLNIAEKRLPQDGRFRMKVADKDLDLRVSFLPTQFGQSVVIRILSSSKLYNLSDLGLLEHDLKILNSLIKKPHGIVFVTGPTGSGKTTTLYSCLSELNRSDKKIITIEDPIEYEMKGITQIQINPPIGLTFASGLRSMLRHDPDIMMVGEVRDVETAEIAVQIALTGHLVFSTLHTNDAAGGATRLIDMGVDPYLITSSVECFIAQRLVRRLCNKCKVEGILTQEMIDDLGVSQDEAAQVKVFDAKGCESCNGTGYLGREGIFEFLLLDDDIKEMILVRSSSSRIKDKAVEKGMVTMLRCGWERVKKGITSPGEIIRVTQEETA